MTEYFCTVIIAEEIPASPGWYSGCYLGNCNQYLQISSIEKLWEIINYTTEKLENFVNFFTPIEFLELQI